jgi:hypothetical protein
VSDSEQNFSVWWASANSVAHTDWLPGAECVLQDALAVSADVRRLGQGRVLSMVDLRPLKSIDRASRQHFMNDHAHYRAVALVADAPVSRMIGNFFLGLHTGHIPVRMFHTPEAATEWLRDQP